MPKAEITETTGCRKTVQIEVEEDRVKDQIQATLKKMKKDIQIPGFRKGKAPESMLLKRFGSVIREEAIKEMIPGVLSEVFKEKDLNPVGEPEITDFAFDGEGPVTFSVSVEEVPEIDTSKFKGLTVTKEIREITDADVDAHLERIREMRAERVEVDREVQNGDIIVVNLQTLDSSGVPIIGEKMEKHVLRLDGQSTPSPEFDEQIVGMKKGETRTVRFTYDGSINNPELVGTTEAYEVELVTVHEHKLPELDDEFAQSLGEFKDMDEFRETSRKNIEAQNEMSMERKFQSDIISEFVKANPFDVPSGMVERVMASEIENMKRYYAGREFDEDGFRTQVRPDAVRAVQSYLITDAVKNQQEIEVTREEMTAKVEELAESEGKDPKEYRRELIKEGHFDSIRNEISHGKVFDWIKEQVPVKEEKVKDEPEKESNIIEP